MDGRSLVRISRLERVDDLHAVDVGSVLHVFGVEPGDCDVSTGGEQEAVPMRQAETLVEFQGVVEDDGSRPRIAAGLKDTLPRRGVAHLPEVQVIKLVKAHAELDHVVVAFLFGTSDGAAKPIVYIGQTEDVHKQLDQHNVNEDF